MLDSHLRKQNRFKGELSTALGGAYSTGALIAKFCSFPGALIRVRVVIRH